MTAAHSTQRCLGCGAVWPEMSAAAACATCGGLLDLEHERPAVTGPALRGVVDPCGVVSRPRGLPTRTSGVWRFRDLILPSVTDGQIVSHPEGNTPLLHRDALDRYAGLDGLELKHEGHNPTGSFKDRGMTVAVTQAVRVGATAVACASTGNTSASLAAYAAQAGLRALVFVPAGKVASGKMAQTLAYGARTLLVRGDFDACLRLARESSERLGVYLANSVNPFRLEGQKTIVFELLQQLDWVAPDWIVLPAGNLGNTSAFGKALREARAWGLIDHVPRLACVQAAGAAPFARAFATGFAERVRVTPETVATAIRIGDPASWDRAVRVIRETNGVVLAVSDEEILAAKAAIDRAGVGCEPASAASLAGIKALVAAGTIRPGERVVGILTGHILKDPDTILQRGGIGGVEIDAELGAVERVLREAP